MAVDPAFESAWLMVTWSQVHAERLQVELAAVASIDMHLRPGVFIKSDYEPDRHGFVLRVGPATSPPPHSWGLRLADSVNCLRSSLDHLAWAVVGRGGKPPSGMSKRDQRGIYFPIYDTINGFDASLSRKLPGVLAADLAVIRAVQPYHGPNIAEHPLAILDSLVQENKHRTLSPPYVLPVTVPTYEVTKQNDCIVTGFVPSGSVGSPLDQGTEVGLYLADRVGPDPYIEVQFHADLAACVKEGIPITLDQWMRTAIRQVSDLLLNFSAIPPSADILYAQHAPPPNHHGTPQ